MVLYFYLYIWLRLFLKEDIVFLKKLCVKIIIFLNVGDDNKVYIYK